MSNETFDQMKAFLVKRYRHDRLYGRDGSVWGNYGDTVVNSYLEDLAENGVCFISNHESITREAVKFTATDITGI